MNTKTCCGELHKGESLPTSYFWPNGRGYLRAACRMCENFRAWVKKNKGGTIEQYYQYLADRENKAQEYRNLAERGLKRCTRCKRALTLDNFYFHPGGGNLNRQSRCKKCYEEMGAKFRAENPKESHRRHLNTYVRKYYGLDSWDDVIKMAESQEYRCAICGEKKELKGTTGLNVDHDHVTGKVRELICFPCNTFLGRLEHSAPQFMDFILYMRKHDSPVLKELLETLEMLGINSECYNQNSSDHEHNEITN